MILLLPSKILESSALEIFLGIEWVLKKTICKIRKLGGSNTKYQAFTVTLSQ